MCPKFPVAFLNKCGAKIQRKNVTKHVDTTCPQSVSTDPWGVATCMFTAVQEDGESHDKCVGNGEPFGPDGEGLCSIEA